MTDLKNHPQPLTDDNAIAIVGMAGRFPGARDLEQFWQNLAAGQESIAFFTKEELLAAGVDPTLVDHPHYVHANGLLENADFFDASFFGYSPREAEATDPQQRLFLEGAWTALEDAGYDPATFPGRIGIYAGSSISTYLLYQLMANPDFVRMLGENQILIGNDKDHLAARVAYKLNLKGPSVNVQTACSTALVAVHLACQSLLTGECDMALAGGISIRAPQKQGYLYHEGGIDSPDGHCRAFDAKAQGAVGGSGLGLVVLKRLDSALVDGDWIYAVIKGSAINNDGADKVGYTAPSINGQAQVIAEALGIAGIDPETVSYVETHGSGTPLGDPIEIAALSQVFETRSPKRGYCALGSVKTNIGHLSAAAGAAGLIKTVLMLQHRQIPPSLNFEQPNPQINWTDSAFFVNTVLRSWEEGNLPRRAGVNSFGLGGTNAHIVLEEPPSLEPSGKPRTWQLLTLSARTEAALEQARANLARHLRQTPTLNMADVAYTLGVGRKDFTQRQILVCRDLDDALSVLETRDPKRILVSNQKTRPRPVAFMFSGVGDQYVNMALGLYQTEATFRSHVDTCAELLRSSLGLDLREVIYPQREQSSAMTELQGDPTSFARSGLDLRKMLRPPEPADEVTQRLNQTALVHPALFVVEYALAQMWMEWGIKPQAMIGHSIGEYVAACLAGVFSLEEALTLITHRARMIQEISGGAMLAVALPEEEIQPFLRQGLSLSAINSPSVCVLAGPLEAVQQAESELMGRGIACRRLQTTHAFHSAMMEPLRQSFAERVSQVALKPPTIQCLSNVTGTWLTAEQATDPNYWADHLCQTVRFADGVRALWQAPDRVLLEIGPGQTLSTLAIQHPGGNVTERVALASLRQSYDRRPDLAFLLGTLGELWLAGIPIDWKIFYAGERRRRIPLPTYPFERQRYWVEPTRFSHATSVRPTLLEEKQEEVTSKSTEPGPVMARHARPNLRNLYVAPRNDLEREVTAIWQKLLGIEQVGVYDNFFELGGHSLMAAQMLTQLRATFPLVEVPLRSVLEDPTIATLAQTIEQLLLEKVEELPEADAERLLLSMS
ncbi:polyketide synthase 7 [Thermoflexales bacterium]|nr:polyketide synthase 7 [Thermoflexales bacterium]